MVLQLMNLLLRNCLPIFQPVPHHIKLLLAQLPRYFTKACCCDHPDYAANSDEENFQRIILGGGDRMPMKSVRNFVFSNGVRNMKVVSPLWLMAGPKTNDADLQVKNDALWSVDSVHTTADGDSDLMTAAQELQGTPFRPGPTETAAARSPPI